MPGRKWHAKWLGRNSNESPKKKGRVPEKLIEYLVLHPRTLPTQESENDSQSWVSLWRSKGKEEMLREVEENSAPPKVQERKEVCLRQAQMRSKDAFRVGEVNCKGEDLQLLLRPKVVAPDGTEKVLDVLIDSGAEANLIRVGLFENLLIPAKNPLRLAAVNGTILEGGDQEISLKLLFEATLREIGVKKVWEEEATFHTGDIHVDLILSYPWMRKQKMGLFAHEHALVADRGKLWLLQGWQAPPPSVSSQF